MDKEQKAMATIIANCWADSQFRARFLADPAGMLRAAGVPLPAGARVQVYESTEDVRHIVLPPPPADLMAEEIAAEDRVPLYSWYSQSRPKKGPKKLMKTAARKPKKKGGAKKAKAKKAGKRKPSRGR